MILHGRATVEVPSKTPSGLSCCIALILKSGLPQTNYYARIEFFGETWYAHRLSYHLLIERIPRSPSNGSRSIKDGLVLHSCDNEWCINPVHLTLGSAKKNSKDMHERGRAPLKDLSKATSDAWKSDRSHMMKSRLSAEYKQRLSESAKRRYRNSSPETIARLRAGVADANRRRALK